MIDLESTDDDISEIQAEIAHLSAVSSPYVTKYYGSFVRGYRLWIVMEYLAGGSCLDLVSAHAPPVDSMLINSSNLETLQKRRLQLYVGSYSWDWHTCTTRERFTEISKRQMCFWQITGMSSLVRLIRQCKTIDADDNSGLWCRRTTIIT